MSFCPQAVIFDMDGLLVDSEPVWAIAESAMMAARGVKTNPEIQRDLVGLRMRDFLAGMRTAYAMTDSINDLSADITARMTALIPEKVMPRPGARELLDYLYERGIPCAIASSSPMAIIDATVAAQNWDRYFQTHVCGDDVPSGKPAPDIYLEAARRLRRRSGALLDARRQPQRRAGGGRRRDDLLRHPRPVPFDRRDFRRHHALRLRQPARRDRFAGRMRMTSPPRVETPG